MVDEPFYSPHRKAPVRQPKPGELLFEFYTERTKKFYRCELRDHGKWGIRRSSSKANTHFTRICSETPQTVIGSFRRASFREYCRFGHRSDLERGGPHH